MSNRGFDFNDELLVPEDLVLINNPDVIILDSDRMGMSPEEFEYYKIVEGVGRYTYTN